MTYFGETFLKLIVKLTYQKHFKNDRENAIFLGGSNSFQKPGDAYMYD
jgi:hypothetical protein